MAQDALSSAQSFLPSQQQIALALAVIRRKPAGMQVRDYIFQLRAQIKHGIDPLDREDPGYYVDQVAYWKERCSRAESECDRLRYVNAKLERSNQLLSNLSSTALGSDGDTYLRAASPMRGVKRPRQTQKRAQNPIAAAQETVDNDLNFLESLGSDGTSLTGALFVVHLLCRSTDPDAYTLCSNLIRSASSLGKVILYAAQNYEPLSRQGRKWLGATSLDKDKSDFANMLSVCARAFMSILVGADKLSKAEDDTRLTSLIVCELTNMFKLALDAIEISAKLTAQSVLSQPSAPTKSKAKVTNPVVKESSPARAITHLLISFLGLLEKADAMHQKIFDGFVFILFERVGKQLYYSTFGQHRSESIESNILSPPQSGDPDEKAKRSLETHATRLEAKALVLILERAMGLAPNHMSSQALRANQPSNRASRSLSLKNIATTSRARLSPLAKDRLQRTLVACMYGTDQDDEFLDILTKPMPQMRLSSMQNVARVENEDVEAWYKGEVWRLVGWDILAREDGW